MPGRPLAGYVALAFGWSWGCWGLAIAAQGSVGGQVAYYAGGFGPALAGLAMTRALGRGVRPWLAGLFRWRVGVGPWAFALLFPVALMALSSGIYALMGGRIDLSASLAGVPAFLPTLVLMALIGGGNEEPGWRGFALPELLRRMAPLPATTLLGAIWAAWHLPLLLLNPAAATMPPAALGAMAATLFVSVTLHAFWYTWLLARGGSVLTCILLHAGYNATNATLVPVAPAEMEAAARGALLWATTGALTLSVLALLAASRGRLGHPAR